MTCSDHLIISWFLLGLKRGRKIRKVVAKKNFVSNKHTVIYIYIYKYDKKIRNRKSETIDDSSEAYLAIKFIS